MRRDLLVGSERIRDPEEGEIWACFAAPFSSTIAPTAPRRTACIDEFVAVEIFAAQRDEKVARLHGPVSRYSGG